MSDDVYELSDDRCDRIQQLTKFACAAGYVAWYRLHREPTMVELAT